MNIYEIEVSFPNDPGYLPETWRYRARNDEGAWIQFEDAVSFLGYNESEIRVLRGPTRVRISQ